MKITHEISVDFKHRGLRPRIEIKENDLATRYVHVSFYRGGEPYAVTVATTDALMCYAKPDGTSGVYDTIGDGADQHAAAVFDIDGKGVTIELAPSMAKGFGLLHCEVRLVSDGQILGTFTFDIDVERSVTTGTRADDYFSYRALDELYEEIDEAKDQSAENSEAISRLSESITEVSDALTDFKDSNFNATKTGVIEKNIVILDFSNAEYDAGLFNNDGSHNPNTTYKCTKPIDVSNSKYVSVRIRSFSDTSGDTGTREIWIVYFGQNGDFISREKCPMYALNANGNINYAELTTSNLAYIGSENEYTYGLGKDFTFGEDVAFIRFQNFKTTNVIGGSVARHYDEDVYSYEVKKESLPKDIIYSEKLASYVDPLAEKIALAAKAHMTDNSSAVILYTDTHYTSTSGLAPSHIVKRLASLVNPQYVIHLGDLAHWATEDKGTALTLWQEHNAIMREIKSPYYQVVGNHDDGCVYNNDVLHNRNASLYAKAEDLFFATTEGDKRTINSVGSRHGWFYVDDETSHIRSIILNSHDYPWIVQNDGTLKFDSRQGVSISACYSAEQIDWFANKALNLNDKEVPSEWAIVVYAHMGTVNWANINILLKAVKNGTDIRRDGLPYPAPSELSDEWADAYRNVNLTVDYSAYGGLPVAFVLGDQHEDMVDVSQGYTRLVVLNASLAKDKASAPIKTKGTPTETAIDVLILDGKSKKITELRFGAGRANGYNPLTDYDNYRVIDW